MSTQSQTISDPSAPGNNSGLPALFSRLLQQFLLAGRALWKQRIWLLFLLPFSLACWKPMQNSFRNWGNPDNLLLYQSLIPFAAALLVWRDRIYLQALWNRMQSYPVTDKRRRGNLVLLSLGCLVVLFGHLVYVDSFFGIGLLLILAGTIYYIYGPVILRALAGPLSLFLLMINPPDSLITKVQTFAVNSTAFATSSLLSLLGKNTSVEQGLIHFPDRFVAVTEPLNGANILVALLLVAFVCAWYQRRTPLYTLCFLVLTSVFVMFIHLVRVIVYALTLPNSPGIARLFLGFSPWFLVLLSGATLIYACQSVDLLSLRMKVAAKQREKYGIQKKGLSHSIEKKMLGPLFKASDKGVLYLSTQNRRMSKSVNSFFKRFIPASRKKRNRW